MSSFIVDDLHITALLSAGLALPEPGSTLTWLDPAVYPANSAGVHEPGAPWGPDAVELARAANRRLTEATVDRVGAMLVDANRRSVNHRNDVDELETIFEYQAQGAPLPSPLETLAAIACYEYQSCEPPTWSSSEARSFCAALREAAIRALPGFDQCPYEITNYSWAGRARRP